MLVLTRKAGETIQIGDGITISVVDLGKGRVKIGIDAPPEVAIRRGELAEIMGPREVTGNPESAAKSVESDSAPPTRRSVLPIVRRQEERGQARRGVAGTDAALSGNTRPMEDAEAACCPWPNESESRFIPWTSVSFP
jgi:carbon storage regulator CsrA